MMETSGKFRFRLFICLLTWISAGFSLPAPAADLVLEFRHFWNGAPIELSGKWFDRVGGDSISFSRIDYLVSGPVLEDSGDRRLAREDWFGLVNAGDPVSRLQLKGLPGNLFSVIEFSVGLDEKTNGSDPSLYPANHPLNPVLNNLHWSWQGGYIFLAMEGHLRAKSGDSMGFSYHIGNTPHRMKVRLPLKLDLSRPARLSLDFHLDRVLRDGRSVSPEGRSSTHGRKGDPLAMLLKKNVENAFVVGGVVYEKPVIKPVSDPAKKSPGVGTPYAFRLKKGFPVPALPIDFPLTIERVELGRRLFNDVSLSSAGSISCASCHIQSNAFSDPVRFSKGVGGQLGNRNSMSLANMAWKRSFFWDGRVSSIREQALEALQNPSEMDADLNNVVALLKKHPSYPSLFKSAFGNQKVTPERIAVAIEQFVLTITSMDSRFDQSMRGQVELSPEEKRGFELFFTEYDPRRKLYGADCFHCHGGSFFTDHGFHNNGLGGVAEDIGLARITGRQADHQKFATPSLRNVAITPPYMHDGRFKNIEEVVEHYTSGIKRTASLDPNLSKHGVKGIFLSLGDRAALVAFLRTLTDPKFKKGE
ncbi:MAG: cytochrome C peroxidase [Opitutae bacterium]|nr:cytochrome C peroxidase [Opitutae bacterium]